MKATEPMEILHDCGCIENADTGKFSIICKQHLNEIGVQQDHMPAFRKGENGEAIDAFRKASMKAIEQAGFLLHYTPDLQIMTIDRQTLNHLYQMAKCWYREMYGKSGVDSGKTES